MRLPLSQLGLFSFFAILFGVGLASFFRVPPSILFGGLFLALLVTVFALVRRYPSLGFAGFLLTLLFFGIARMEWERRSVPFELEGRVIQTEATISKITSRGTRNFIEVDSVFEGRSLRLQFQAPGSVPYTRGERILLSGTLTSISAESLRTQDLLRRDGVSFILNTPITTPVDPQPFSIVRLLDAAKTRFESGIAKAVPVKDTPYVLGVLLGDQRGLSKEVKDEFSRTGTSHLIALSGFNITIIAIAIAWALGLFHTSQRVRLFGSVLGIALFVIAVGGSASVVRAAVMGVLALVARERGRIYDMTNALAFAGVVMVLMNPYLLRFDLSFQLSFLATLGIVIVPISLERYTFWLPKWLSEIVLATLGAELFVMPLIVYYFGTIPLFGLFANVLILPTVSFLMLVTFLTGVMGLVSHFAAVITGFFVQIIAGYHLFVIHWFAKLPVLSAGPFIAALLALIPFLWTCFYLRRRFRPQLPAVN